MGDEAAEDLFVLAALAGIDNVSILLCPVDFRTRELPPDMSPGPRRVAPVAIMAIMAGRSWRSFLYDCKSMLVWCTIFQNRIDLHRQGRNSR